jgi:hypothetical protein
VIPIKFGGLTASFIIKPRQKVTFMVEHVSGISSSFKSHATALICDKITQEFVVIDYESPVYRAQRGGGKKAQRMSEQQKRANKLS